MTKPLPPSDSNRAFRAIADPTRRDIIELLAADRGGLNISQLSAQFDISRQGVTKHIKTLEEAGLVRIEKQGRERTCHADLLTLKTVYDWVRLYEQFWSEKLDRLGEHLDESA